jgi:alpha-ketoglutarate-dependent taurine dioxygenase
VHPELPEDADHSHLSNALAGGTGGSAEVMRHQDFTWTVPLRAISLYAVEVPADGGDTVFYNAELALALLDPALRSVASGLRAIHFDRYADARVHRAAAPLEAEHPVVLRHPDTGSPVLFVDEQTTKELVGAGDGAGVLTRLLSVFDRPELQYAHRWRPGDVIVWDNLSLQHSRTAFPAEQPRTLRRIQID